MKKCSGLLESIDGYLTDNPIYHFGMPAHSGRYINPKFKAMLDKYGVDKIEGSQRAIRNVSGYDVTEGGVLSDLGGPLYHEAFNSQMTLLLQSGSTSGN